MSSGTSFYCHTGRYAVAIRYLPKIVTHPKEHLQVVRLLRRYRLGGRYDGKKCYPEALFAVIPEDAQFLSGIFLKVLLIQKNITFKGSQVIKEIPARRPLRREEMSSGTSFCCHTGRYAVSIRYLPNSVTCSKEYLPVARLLRRYRLGGRYGGKKCHPGPRLKSLLP